MREYILGGAILLLIALAVRSMIRSVAEMPLGILKGSLDDDEELQVPDIDPGHEWIHDRLVAAFGAEHDGWAVEQVRRIDARLQANVPADQRLETVVLWIPEASAFTMPGRHVYISRRLLERMGGRDEPVALVIAHEMAHHRLGHVAGAELLDRVPAVMRDFALDLALVSTRVLHGAEREADSDAAAFDLCLAAGYDAHACLRAFDVLEEIALDHGDVEGATGSASVMESEIAGDPEWVIAAKKWLYERRRGYFPLEERKARLLAAYEAAAAAKAA
ncbi:MAG: M48 family metalloprotease [Gemmatimonadetes bacterium]|nr:M48 family metalloprotease [Gemmatimonadota bacterium]